MEAQQPFQVLARQARRRDHRAQDRQQRLAVAFQVDCGAVVDHLSIFTITTAEAVLFISLGFVLKRFI
jgi:hypothetical protein